MVTVEKSVSGSFQQKKTSESVEKPDSGSFQQSPTPGAVEKLRELPEAFQQKDTGIVCGQVFLTELFLVIVSALQTVWLQGSSRSHASQKAATPRRRERRCPPCCGPGLQGRGFVLLFPLLPLLPPPSSSVLLRPPSSSSPSFVHIPSTLFPPLRPPPRPPAPVSVRSCTVFTSIFCHCPRPHSQHHLYSHSHTHPSCQSSTNHSEAPRDKTQRERERERQTDRQTILLPFSSQ